MISIWLFITRNKTFEPLKTKQYLQNVVGQNKTKQRQLAMSLRTVAKGCWHWREQLSYQQHWYTSLHLDKNKKKKTLLQVVQQFYETHCNKWLTTHVLKKKQLITCELLSNAMKCHLYNKPIMYAYFAYAYKYMYRDAHTVLEAILRK